MCRTASVLSVADGMPDARGRTAAICPMLWLEEPCERPEAITASRRSPACWHADYRSQVSQDLAFGTGDARASHDSNHAAVDH